MIEFPPGLILILGALLVPFLRGNLLRAYMLALPIAGFWGLTQIAPGTHFTFEFFGYTLTPVRVDALSLAFGYIFHIAAALGIIYAFHMRDKLQMVAGLVYAGSAVGAVFAGDLISLFVFWEGTAIASVFLVWASRSESAYRSGMRYLIIQIGSGVLLLAGAILHVEATGSIAFEKMTLTGLGPTLIFIAFGIKAAFPLLHNWLPDVYPEATVTGTVFLSAFTTKLAVYALARGFPGTEILIWIGAVMALGATVYAILNSDLRRVLAYALQGQLGFMVVGVGIGTELALNGTTAHAMASVLYKGLLFMAMGAVLLRTGTAEEAELGGLYRSMPWTAAFCIVGALSISALPFFSGFVSKSLTVSAASEGHTFAWLALVTASVGVIFHAGLRLPYFAFFHGEPGRQVQEAPSNMLVAMGLAAFLCFAIGVYPPALYAVLPYAVDYVPYTLSYIATQVLLVGVFALAFGLLVKTGLCRPLRNFSLPDFDWTYRSLLPALLRAIAQIYVPMDRALRAMFVHRLERLLAGVFRTHGPEGVLARTWPTGSTVLWVAVLLALYMLFYFF